MIRPRRPGPPRAAAFAAAVAIPLGSAAQDAPTDGPPARDAAPTENAPFAPTGVAGLEARLAALSPDEPMAYFRLAEEVAYEYATEPARRLAQRLFVLSFELDRRSARPAGDGLGASVALALADLSTDETERRWLLALASFFRGSSPGPAPGPGGTGGELAGAGAEDDLGRRLAEAAARLRGGDPTPVRILRNRADLPTWLRDVGFPPDEADEYLAELERVAGRIRRSPRSQDGRVIKRIVDGDQIVELDPITRGNPGPSLDADELVAQLRVEGLLVGADPRDWAAAELIHAGRPLRDVDADELAPALSVDPTRTVWRLDPSGRWPGGRWVDPGEDAPAGEPG